ISIDANFIVFPKVLILGAAIVMQGTQVKNCFYYYIGCCHTSVTLLKRVSQSTINHKWVKNSPLNLSRYCG
ncbi:MAG: hypothetical protein AAFN67_04885, partial [Pseudomonadota bacterium]